MLVQSDSRLRKTVVALPCHCTGWGWDMENVGYTHPQTSKNVSITLIKLAFPPLEKFVFSESSGRGLWWEGEVHTERGPTQAQGERPPVFILMDLIGEELEENADEDCAKQYIVVLASTLPKGPEIKSCLCCPLVVSIAIVDSRCSRAGENFSVSRKYSTVLYQCKLKLP